MRQLALLCALSLLIGPATLGAQEAPSASFGEEVEVRVVNVDVQVTDADGVPIDNLQKKDFELLVDGKPVPISNFATASRPLTAPAVTPPSAPEAAPEPAASEPEAAAPHPRLIVWLDDLHLIPAHRNRVLKELASLLEDQEKLGVDVGIMRFDRSVQLLRAPGDRSRPIDRVLAEEARRTASGILGYSAHQLVFEQIENLYGQWKCKYTAEMEEAVRRYAVPLRNDVLSSYEALKNMVAGLAGLPGRRAVLYVADSLPMEPGQDAYLFIDQLCPRGGQGLSPGRQIENLAIRLHEVSAAANAAGVSFYSYQAGGLPVPSDASSFTGGLDAGNAMIARANDQNSFQTLASDTGGRALINSNHVEPLVEQMADDWSNYYSLGFTPSGPADGKQHHIEVRVKRAGVKVRHRETFLDRPAGAARTDRLLALLQFGTGGENPLDIQVEVAKLKPVGKKDTIELPLRILVPAGKLVFMPGRSGAARLEVAVAVSDDRGRMAPIQRRALSITRAKLAKDLDTVVLRIPFDLTVRRGPTNLAISVRDVVGDTTSFLEHSLDLR